VSAVWPLGPTDETDPANDRRCEQERPVDWTICHAPVVIRYLATIAFLTPTGAVREWRTEVETDNAERATETAMRAFRASPPGRTRPEVVGVELERL
jgi:hypothetical protein